MTKKRGITLGAILVLVVVLLLILVREKPFDASGYVEATLEQTLQGKTAALEAMVTDATAEELQQQYESGVETFVDTNILNQIAVEGEARERFVALWKEVLRSLSYQVQEAEKISRDEYQVEVLLQPTDVFIQFVNSVELEQEFLKAKVEEGTYIGTQEEIEQAMQEDVLAQRYQSLQNALASQQVGEERSVTIKVIRGEDDLFGIDEANIRDILWKILRLDEIQD